MQIQIVNSLDEWVNLICLERVASSNNKELLLVRTHFKPNKVTIQDLLDSSIITQKLFRKRDSTCKITTVDKTAKKLDILPNRQVGCQMN